MNKELKEVIETIRKKKHDNMGKEADLNNDHMELLEWKIESLKIESMKNMNKRVRRMEGGMRTLSKFLKRTPEWETRENMRQYLKYIDHQIEKAQALSRIIRNKSTTIKITLRGWNTKDKMIEVTTENMKEQQFVWQKASQQPQRPKVSGIISLRRQGKRTINLEYYNHLICCLRESANSRYFQAKTKRVYHSDLCWNNYLSMYFYKKNTEFERRKRDGRSDDEPRGW